jgi:hypothetical protein
MSLLTAESNHFNGFLGRVSEMIVITHSYFSRFSAKWKNSGSYQAEVEVLSIDELQ